MGSQVFYRKWRPQTLAEVVGQDAVVQTLRNALSSGRVSHAYLFCGPRGTGKTSMARILAKAVNCLTYGNGEPCNTCSICQAISEARALDVIEIDAASNTGVDDIRSLRERVNYAANQARYKVYIIDEVHMLSNSASNALLKTLEEPPPHVIFVLATTEAHKILPTIVSRCQRFDFRRLTQADIIAKLAHICGTEGIQVELEALRLIARSATGSLRDAENLLQQMTTYHGSKIALEQVKTTLGITGDWRARELARHIMNKDITAGMKTINSVSSDGLDLRQFNRELVEYLRALLLVKTGSAETLDLTPEDTTELKEWATHTPLEHIVKAARLFAQLDFRFDNYSTLPLELALADSTIAPEREKDSYPPPPDDTVRISKGAPKKPAYAPSDDSRPARAATPSPASSVRQQPAVRPERASIAASPMPATPATPATPLEANSDIERLRLNWKQVIEQAPPDIRRTPAVAILRSAGVKPVALDNDIVSLAFRHSYHKEQIEKIENQRIAERVISNFLGRPCHVQCVLEDNHLLKAALKMGAEIIDTEE